MMWPCLKKKDEDVAKLQGRCCKPVIEKLGAAEGTFIKVDQGDHGLTFVSPLVQKWMTASLWISRGSLKRKLPPKSQPIKPLSLLPQEAVVVTPTPILPPSQEAGVMTLLRVSRMSSVECQSDLPWNLGTFPDTRGTDLFIFRAFLNTWALRQTHPFPFYRSP